MHTSGVLITGTTSGVGRALLEHYAKQGARIVAVNRRRLPELEAQFPEVRFECLDVRSEADVERFVRGLADSGELPDVFLLSAGINRIDNDQFFHLAQYREVIDTNLYGVLNFVAPLTQLSIDGVQRHVVAISSMVRYAGNPYGLGYTTSKRALTACFEVWSRMYTGTDLVFQQVMLGPVRTSIYTMAERFPAWMGWTKDLFSASLAGTARAIGHFASTRDRTLIYPLRALPLFAAIGLAQRYVPGFYHGRKTLDGKRRRATPVDVRSRNRQ